MIQIKDLPFQGLVLINQKNINSHKTGFYSSCSLPSITIAAEHLAVLSDRTPTITPGSDVVALHELHVELPAAKGAAVLLPLPYSQLDVLGEDSQIEMALIACQYVGDDACLALYLTVAHQL